MEHVYVFTAEYDGDRCMSVYATREDAEQSVIDACQDGGFLTTTEEFGKRTEHSVRYDLLTQGYVEFRSGQTMYCISREYINGTPA